MHRDKGQKFIPTDFENKMVVSIRVREKQVNFVNCQWVCYSRNLNSNLPQIPGFVNCPGSMVQIGFQFVRIGFGFERKLEEWAKFTADFCNSWYPKS